MTVKRAAISYGVYVQGSITLTDGGVINCYPESAGEDFSIQVLKTSGYKIVNFEELVNELIQSKIEPKVPKTNDHFNSSTYVQWCQYQDTCRSVGRMIFALIRSGGSSIKNMANHRIEFAEKLKKAVSEMSIKDVGRIPWIAVQMDVEPSDISLWLEGKFMPCSSELTKLALVLNKPENYFI